MNIEKTEAFHIFQLIYVDEISSTNTFLKEQYGNYSDYTVLIAKKQTSGRGRYNRAWISNDDICFSILFKKPAFHAVIAPLAIVRALEHYNCQTYIKWPNDIYLTNKKLAGILIEDVYEKQLMASIVGIGMNKSDKPSVQGIGLSGFVDAPTNELIKSILIEYESLLHETEATLLASYKKYSFVLGKKIFYQGQEYFVTDISTNGNLVLMDQNQRTRVICSDEISIKDALIDKIGK